MRCFILAFLGLSLLPAFTGCWTPHLPQPRPPVIISRAALDAP